MGGSKRSERVGGGQISARGSARGDSSRNQLGSKLLNGRLRWRLFASSKTAFAQHVIVDCSKIQ